MPSIPSWELVVRAVLIYAGLLIALRLFGKREVGQFTLYDLVFILLVANALQPAITGPDTSLGSGFVLIVALVGTNYLVGKLDSMPRFHSLFTPAPAIIIRNGKYIPAVMKKEGVDQPEVEMSMREHGITDMKDVQLAVLEPDGTISIVPTGVAMTRTKHRIRYHHRSG
ncbi:MAG TPA: YetF domain-containing protein [Candidatus Dormibacteraeota bacterium]|nr:YetF domain-containing protein [Candidatus Dormibacteraeota bacterium]